MPLMVCKLHAHSHARLYKRICTICLLIILRCIHTIILSQRFRQNFFLSGMNDIQIIFDPEKVSIQLKNFYSVHQSYCCCVYVARQFCISSPLCWKNSTRLKIHCVFLPCYQISHVLWNREYCVTSQCCQSCSYALQCRHRLHVSQTSNESIQNKGGVQISIDNAVQVLNSTNCALILYFRQIHLAFIFQHPGLDFTYLNSQPAAD